MSVSWGIWSYALPLKRKLAVLGSNQQIRTGFLIGNKRQGEWFFGEAAPLPSFHKITLKDVFEQLRSWIKDPNLDRLCDLHSVAQFAIQSSLCDYDPSSPIPINGLCTGAEDLDRRYRSLKLKVGRQSVEEDLQSLSALAARNLHCSFKLDANSLWSFEEVSLFWRGVREHDLVDRVEYIEDPTDDPSKLPELCDFPLALDQLLDEEWLSLSALKAIVVKPSLQGGISGVEKWKRKADEHNLSLVLSSTFETSIGIGRIAQLADPNTVHGLGTLRWFSEDICTPIKHRGDLLFPHQSPPKLFKSAQREQ